MYKQILLSEGKLSALLENFFLLFLGSYLVVAVLRTTSLEYASIPFFTAIIAVGLLVVITVRFFFLHDYSTKETVLYVALLAIVLLVVLRNRHDTLVMLFLLVVASKGVDYSKIVLVQLAAVIEVLLFSAALSQNGISADYGFSSFASLKAFGVCNTTDFSAYTLFIVFGYAFLRGKRISFVEVAIFVVGGVWVYEQTEAKTSFFSLLIFCILVVLHKLMEHFSLEPIKKLAPLGIAVMPALSLLMLGLSFTYSEQNALAEKIDNLFTHRIMLGHIGLEKYGLRLLGNHVIEFGNGFGARPDSYFFLDSSYMRLLLIDGLLVYIIVMFLYSAIYKKLLAEKNYIGIIIFFALSITCLAEQHLLEPWYNPFTFMCLTRLSPQNEMGSHERPTLTNHLKKNAIHLLFSVGVLVYLLLSINFHTDGSSITPGRYFINRAPATTNVWDFDESIPSRVFIVDKQPDNVSLQKTFTLVFLEDKTYYIEDDLGKRLTLGDDEVIMAEPSGVNSDNQKWEIRRWKTSSSFTIKNIERPFFLDARGPGPLQYDYYIDDADQFLFQFTRSPI